MSEQLAAAIDQAWERRESVTPATGDVREAVEAAIELLDSGQARVAEPDGAVLVLADDGAGGAG